MKKTYYERKFENIKGDLKQTWKLINDLTKRNKQESVKETEFKVDNTLINDNKEIANKFNEYFLNVGPNLAKKIEVHTDAIFKSYLQGDYVESMMLSPTYKKEVEEVIKNMDPVVKTVFFQE